MASLAWTAARSSHRTRVVCPMELADSAHRGTDAVAPNAVLGGRFQTTHRLGSGAFGELLRLTPSWCAPLCRRGCSLRSCVSSSLLVHAVCASLTSA